MLPSSAHCAAANAVCTGLIAPLSNSAVRTSSIARLSCVAVNNVLPSSKSVSVQLLVASLTEFTLML